MKDNDSRFLCCKRWADGSRLCDGKKSKLDVVRLDIVENSVVAHSDDTCDVYHFLYFIIYTQLKVIFSFYLAMCKDSKMFLSDFLLSLDSVQIHIVCCLIYHLRISYLWLRSWRRILEFSLTKFWNCSDHSWFGDVLNVMPLSRIF